MSTWNDLATAANTAFFAIGGETIAYSRPGNSTLDPIDEFVIVGIPDTSVASTGGNAKERVMQVQISDIPLGPKAGDLIVNGANTYRVEQILSSVTEDDIATLGIRLINPNS
jgi:hypothetical protein